MFKRNDKIGVGVSGGKDSLVLLHLLNKKNYDVHAICIDEGIKGYREETIPFVEKYCAAHDIPLTLVSAKKELGKSIDEAHELDPSTPSCSYCGVFRRELLNRTARNLGCDKMATGHNLDDESQVALMNFFRGETQRMARTGAVTGTIKHENFVTRVKPLRDCPEKETVIYALVNGIEYDDIECPYAVDAFRGDIRDFLNQMEEKRPGTKFAVLNSFDRLQETLKKGLETDSKPGHCKQCGELTNSEICKKCLMLNKLSK